ncbi:hypothetical protein [Stieleria varia]|uniref:Uncharacterized protein n=1 Tax=Stieleria varia TaxID=2528005 RepID=A0A5C6AU13_9BACT|nr:hypothetical protein [Stieleria varia]TWU02967.1 hypothetical protein Pla52n_40560 [Stieleria varia]
MSMVQTRNDAMVSDLTEQIAKSHVVDYLVRCGTTVDSAMETARKIVSKLLAGPPVARNSELLRSALTMAIDEVATQGIAVKGVFVSTPTEVYRAMEPAKQYRLIGTSKLRRGRLTLQLAGSQASDANGAR